MTQNDSTSEDPALTENDLTLGTIAESHSQMDYIVKVYR